jgi:uncharacterized GH25 family protein
MEDGRVKDRIFLDTTDFMIYGHEGWLEKSFSHAHKGENVNICFNWGHNMQPHGSVREEGLSAYVVGPDGKREDLPVGESSQDGYVISFLPETEGVYHVVCENRGYYVVDVSGKHLRGTLREYPDASQATAFIQYSHVMVSVGHDIPEEEAPRMPEIPLCLRPAKWRKWRAGDEIEFSLYFQNRPVSHTPVDVAFSKGFEEEVAQSAVNTDENGVVRIKAETPGKYLAIVRYTHPQGEEGICRDTRFTYTLSFIVVK